MQPGKGRSSTALTSTHSSGSQAEFLFVNDDFFIDSESRISNNPIKAAERQRELMAEVSQADPQPEMNEADHELLEEAADYGATEMTPVYLPSSDKKLITTLEEKEKPVSTSTAASGSSGRAKEHSEVTKSSTPDPEVGAAEESQEVEQDARAHPPNPYLSNKIMEWFDPLNHKFQDPDRRFEPYGAFWEDERKEFVSNRRNLRTPRMRRVSKEVCWDYNGSKAQENASTQAKSRRCGIKPPVLLQGLHSQTS
ncbi:unnamed protein product [Amoebophrya sp. A25]|nr:unnamed protein product [Amoebophrya sp. A25]|eukprot:GSA25T00007075001.1